MGGVSYGESLGCSASLCPLSDASTHEQFNTWNQQLAAGLTGTHGHSRHDVLNGLIVHTREPFSIVVTVAAINRR